MAVEALRPSRFGSAGVSTRALDSRTLGRWAFNGVAGGVMAFILLPLFFVTWLSFFRQEIPSFPPDGYSLRWYSLIWSNAKFTDGFLLSLQIAIGATIFGLVLGVPAALCIARFRFLGREPLNNLLLLPLVVPGIVLGTAIYVFHVELQILIGRIEALADYDINILGSLGALIAAHVLLVIPWSVRLVSASLAGFDRSIEEAALSLGATPITAFFRITLPVIRPGIVAAGLFGFVVSFGNLEMTLFLVGAGRTTLPIAILQYLEWKIDPTIAAVSVLQILLIGTAMFVTDRFVKLSRVV